MKKGNKKAINLFNDSYFIGQVSSSIIDVKIKGAIPNISSEELSKRYEDLGITQLNKDYFYKNADLSSKEKEKFWKRYSHRDDLIKTGQYYDIIEQIYKDNYLNALIKNNVNRKYIELFSSLSLDEWRKVAYIPNSKKSQKESNMLPNIPLYYEGKSVVNGRDTTESDLDASIDLAGFKDRLNEFDNLIKNERVRPTTPRKRAIYDAITRYEEDPRNLANRTARVIGTLPRDIRDTIKIPTNSQYEYEIRYKIYQQLEAKGRLYNKYGNIPFVKNDEKRGYLSWKSNQGK